MWGERDTRDGGLSREWGRGPGGSEDDLTRHPDPKHPDKMVVKARLLDLVVGRSGPAYAAWLCDRGAAFRARVEVATLDPFRGYKNAIDDQLADAVAVLDAFHVVKLAGHALDEVRRRVQQEIHGHRGRKNDPLYRIRNILHAGAEHLTERQQARLAAAIAADERHDEVWVAYQCAQQVRAAYHQNSHAAGRAVAEKVLDSFPSSPIPDLTLVTGWCSAHVQRSHLRIRVRRGPIPRTKRSRRGRRFGQASSPWPSRRHIRIRRSRARFSCARSESAETRPLAPLRGSCRTVLSRPVQLRPQELLGHHGQSGVPHARR